MSISTLTSFAPSLKPNPRLLHSNFSPRSSSNTLKPLIVKQRRTFSGLDAKKFGLSFGTTSGLCLKAKNEEVEKVSVVDEGEEAVRNESTLPERFRPYYKNVPEKPVTWPYFLALPFIFYAWRTVVWELGNWRNIIMIIPNFFLDLFKVILAGVLMIIGNPITISIRAIETLFYTVRALYSYIINYTPVPELSVIIMLTSATLAIAEVAKPGSVNRQQNQLTLAGLAGFLAVRSVISEPLFYTVLLGLSGYNHFVKKDDYLSSFLPVVSVLVAVGEPWFRFLVMSAYLGAAIVHHSKTGLTGKDENGYEEVRVPVPLMCAAFAVGLRLAAKWVGYRHLIWMTA
jgi:hypothetical protein